MYNEYLQLHFKFTYNPDCTLYPHRKAPSETLLFGMEIRPEGWHVLAGRSEEAVDFDQQRRETGEEVGQEAIRVRAKHFSRVTSLFLSLSLLLRLHTTIRMQVLSEVLLSVGIRYSARVPAGRGNGATCYG